MSDPVHLISLGAGVQSSTMALMAAHGGITPMPKAAIFSDVGGGEEAVEPMSVYRWLDWLEKQLPFPVYRVWKGNLKMVALTLREKKDGTGTWTKSLLPVYTLDEEGQRGHMRRACTYDYKLMPLMKAARKLGNIKRGQKHVGVVQWVGFSTDEASRMKPSLEPWAEVRWPLIEKNMSRRDCFKWMESHGYPKPPRSACYFCPYHSDAEWIRLKTEEPDEFKKAIEFERELQRTKGLTTNMRSVPYLHASRKPLSEVVFDERKQLDLFENSCEGMCGV